MKKAALIAENEELKRTLDKLIYQPTSVESLVYLLERSMIDQIISITWGGDKPDEFPSLSDVITFYVENHQ